MGCEISEQIIVLICYSTLLSIIVSSVSLLTSPKSNRMCACPLVRVPCVAHYIAQWCRRHSLGHRSQEPKRNQKRKIKWKLQIASGSLKSVPILQKVFRFFNRVWEESPLDTDRPVSHDDNIRAKHKSSTHKEKSHSLCTLHVTLCWQGSGKNEVEWTTKAEVR